MSTDIARALVLIEQGRFSDAHEHLQRAIGQDPESAHAHALLALCLSEANRKDEALAAAQRAIALEPDDPYPHYAMGWVLLESNQPRRAVDSARESLRLDPRNPDTFALLSQCHVRMSKFPEALEAAEAGLAIDAEHIGCINLRSMALTHLGRKEDAALGVATALAKDPEHATTHANAGWGAMHAGDYRAAMTSFKEALRLDPQNEWARHGMAEAMKGGSLLYRPIHRFQLWTSRLSTGQALALVIAFPIANRVLRSVERSNPEWTPIVQPIVYLLLFFVYLTWIATPIGNVVLLAHPYGRLLLDRGTTRVAAACGALFLAGIVGVVSGLVIDDMRILLGGVAALGLIIPIHGTGSLLPGMHRNLLWGATAALALAGIAIVLVPELFFVFILGLVVYTWVHLGVSARQRAGV